MAKLPLTAAILTSYGALQQNQMACKVASLTLFVIICSFTLGFATRKLASTFGSARSSITPSSDSGRQSRGRRRGRTSSGWAQGSDTGNDVLPNAICFAWPLLLLAVGFHYYVSLVFFPNCAFTNPWPAFFLPKLATNFFS